MIDYNEIAMRFLTPASVAKVRLRGIVAADRESAPCWRWRKVERVEYGFVPWPYGMTKSMLRGFKRHYCWEQRR